MMSHYVHYRQMEDSKQKIANSPIANSHILTAKRPEGA